MYGSPERSSGKEDGRRASETCFSEPRLIFLGYTATSQGGGRVSGQSCVIHQLQGWRGQHDFCVETAASLAGRFNAKVLLIDLDPQTNATLSVMYEKEWETHASKKGTLREFFAACYEGKPFDLTSIRYEYDKHPLGKNLHLIPSHLELFGIDLQLATKFGYQNIQAKVFLRNALKPLSSQYDFILIDCPPNIYLAT